ncbi:hypothetical protein CY34DRAFT_751595 [Suillus luteus UH-Slu-Lm8-n1]|uniref:Uncharacterized protein n=1 Tax=Suillus luteus UH-Slu-Lm8-n1 TaxID=930992 RepID=A0A0D0B907_9AGAM|nr:hypothetical protein CY34DRAFT_751595 [Suillus luteus UH-Slu-Lm8-n1]
MFSASHASTDNHISKLSLTELTCSQSHYIFYVCIYLVVELKCLAKSPPLYRNICTGSTLLCIQHLDYAIRVTASPDCMHFRFDTCPVGFPCLAAACAPKRFMDPLYIFLHSRAPLGAKQNEDDVQSTNTPRIKV